MVCNEFSDGIVMDASMLVLNLGSVFEYHIWKKIGFVYGSDSFTWYWYVIEKKEPWGEVHI